MSQRSRNWYGVITDLAWIDAHSDHYVASQLAELCEGPMLAFRGQLERGELGALHHQLWFRFKSAKTMSAVLRILRTKFECNISLRKVDHKIPDQLKYVSKDTDLTATPKVYGRIADHDVYEGPADQIARLVARGQGSRSDVRRMKDMVLDDRKVPISDLIEECGIAGTYVHVIKLLRTEKQPNRPRNQPHTAAWLWGSGGVGKSRLANQELERATGEEPYSKNSREYWADYQWQKGISYAFISPLGALTNRTFSGVIFDEFKGRFPISDVRAWVDQYTCKVPVYHGGLNLCTSHSAVVSNKSPIEYYPRCADVDRNALFSRFTFYKVTGDGNEAERQCRSTYIMKMKYDQEGRCMVPQWPMPRKAGCEDPDAVLFD